MCLCVKDHNIQQAEWWGSGWRGGVGEVEGLVDKQMLLKKRHSKSNNAGNQSFVT